MVQSPDSPGPSETEPATSSWPLKPSAETWFFKADHDCGQGEKAGEDLALRDQLHSRLCLTA